MRANNIKDEDIDEKFILGSGRGGQKLQKSSTCVYLKHKPTGITVKCQSNRSREDNRFFARRRLLEKIQTLRDNIKTKAQQQANKIRRQKKRRSRRAKQKLLDDKHHQASKKQRRQKPNFDD